MKLIIDIPNNLYDVIYSDNYGVYKGRIYDIIRNGIPLDDVKAEIAEEICLTDNPYTKETKYTIEHLRLLEILDNIGKAESEDKE